MLSYLITLITGQTAESSTRKEQVREYSVTDSKIMKQIISPQKRGHPYSFAAGGVLAGGVVLPGGVILPGGIVLEKWRKYIV
jgi:hypothetical protein